jgi:hypothetical protein
MYAVRFESRAMNARLVRRFISVLVFALLVIAAAEAFPAQLPRSRSANAAIPQRF